MHQMFPYLGSKKRVASKYPAPGTNDVVYEPFAGAAGYSVYHSPKKAILCDVHIDVCRAWQCLIDAGSGKRDLRELPLLEPGENITGVDDDAAALIGFWCVRGVESARDKLPDSGWVRKYPNRFWGEYQRNRLQKDAYFVKDWEIYNCDFTELDGDGVWFIDPPYQKAGKYYRHKFSRYAELRDFAYTRNHSVIVCEEEIENHRPDWMNFDDMFFHVTTQKRKAKEIAWISGNFSTRLI